MKQENLFIHLSPAGVFGYTLRVLSDWNIRYRVIKSHGNSWYIKLELGTPAQPKAKHIRISDHDAVYESSRYDFDVMCWAAREGTHGIKPVTYLKLLEILADQLDREIPPLCRTLLGYRKEHSVRLQHNRRHLAWRPAGRKVRFFLDAS